MHMTAWGHRFSTVRAIQAAPSALVGDFPGSLLAEQVEEGMKRPRVGPVGGVDEPATVVVDDHQQVAVVATVGDFVDPDASHAREEILVVEVLHHPRDDLSDRAPRAAQQSSGRARGHLHRAPGGELLEGHRVARTMSRPGNGRHHHAVLGATDPRNACDDEHLGASEVECAPVSFAARVVAGTACLAMWAAPTMLDSWSQSYLENVTDELDILNSHTLGIDAKGPR
jgi:hypothetical protein